MSSSLLPIELSSRAMINDGRDVADVSEPKGTSMPPMLRHFSVLTVKNVWLLMRRLQSTFTLLILPTIMVLILLAIANWVRSILSAQIFPTVSHAPFTPAYGKCQILDVYGSATVSTDSCTTIVYAPNTPVFNNIMSTVVQSVGLSSRDIRGYADQQSMMTAASTVGTVDTMIFFDSNAPSQSQSPGPFIDGSALQAGQFNYRIWYNGSSYGDDTGGYYSGNDNWYSIYSKLWLNKANWRIITLQFVLEQVLLQAAAINVSNAYPTTPKSDFPPLHTVSPTALQHQFFTLPPLQTTSGSIDSQRIIDGARARVLQYGGTPAMTLITTIFALIIISLVTKEKQDKLLASLRMNGLNESAYWYSYFVSFSIIALFASIFAISIGMATGLTIFTNVNFFIHLLALTLFIMSMIALALFLSSFVSQNRWVNVLSFFFLIIAVISVLFIYPQDKNLLFTSNSSTAFTLFVSSLPWLHYGKIWADMYAHSSLQSVTNTTDSRSLNPFNYPQANVYSILVQQTYSINQLYDVQYIQYSSYPSCNWNDFNCCQNFYPASCATTMSSGASMAILFALCIFYVTLAWYFGQVCSAGGKPWFFPCTPSYYGYGFKSGQRAIEGDTIKREQIASLRDRSIRTVKLSKQFGGVTAVKEMSVVMESNQCFVLLGHNGAGKSTLINVLTGMFPASNGEAFIAGNDIKTDLAAVQAMTGICLQDNVHYSDLSVEEHMFIFGTLRNVPATKLRANIELRLREVNLWDHRNKYTRELSGGMKRRLSIAMAMIGSPQVVFLDEPTTGMDTLHRLEVWEIIKNIKVGRVVVLTTHNMEEADYLGDTIALMSGGRLRAIGTCLFLKNTYGRGYQLQLLVDPVHVERFEDAIKRYLVGAEIVGNQGGALTVAMKRPLLKNVPLLFHWMSEARNQSAVTNGGGGPIGVRGWSLASSTLDEVFLRLCENETRVNAAIDDGEDESVGQVRLCLICHERPVDVVTLYTAGGVEVTIPNVICAQCGNARPMTDADRRLAEEKSEEAAIDWVTAPTNGADTMASPAVTSAGSAAEYSEKPSVVPITTDLRATFYSQWRALVLKNLSLMLTEWKSWIFRLFVLVITVFLLYLTVILNATSVDRCEQGYTAPCRSGADLTAYLFLTDINSLQQSTPADLFRVLDQTTATSSRVYNTRFTNPYAVPSTTGQMSPLTDPSSMMNASVYDTSSNGDFAKLNFGNGVGVYQNVDFQRWNEVNSQLSANEASVMSKSTANTCYNGGSRSSVLAWTIDQSPTVVKPIVDSLYPDIGLNVGALTATNFNMTLVTYVTDIDTLTMLPIIYAANCQDMVTAYSFNSNYGYKGVYSQSHIPYTLHSINNALLRQAVANFSTLPPSGSPSSPVILGSIIRFSKLSFDAAISSVVYAVAVALVALLSMLLLPWMADRAIYEREEKLFHMMRIAGLKSSTYWLATYSFDYTVGFIWTAVAIVVGFAAGLAIFTDTNFGLWLFLLLIWSHCQVCLAWFASAFFSTRRIASIVLYVIVIVATASSFFLEEFLATDDYPTWLLFIPPMAYTRSLSLIFRYGGSSRVLFSSSSLPASLSALFFISTALMAIGIYLNTLHYRPPLFFVEEIQQLLKRRNRASEEDERHQRLLMDDESSDAADVLDKEDPDVRRERLRVESADRTLAVSIEALSKSYPVRGSELRCGAGQSKLAVNSLYLGADYGDCFGLLGPNGAGKSTVLSILSGLFNPTKGRALVGGYDVQTQRSDVFNILGVCPQFDCVWGDLSVRSHLLFYARLKGALGGEAERAQVQRMAEMVALDGDAYDRPASQLSGGMRRRLSIAASLIGNPKVWLLDEPTTGLSVDVRREIWAIVSAQKSLGRCTIITTHSMEEADTLCNRIGIVSAGRLQCIGTQAHLKDRFGAGFKLTISTARTSPINFIRSATDQQTPIDDYAQRIVVFVDEKIFRGAILQSINGKQMIFILPTNASNANTESIAPILNVFNQMERYKGELRSVGIDEWGISNSSLDDVFITVVKAAEGENDDSAHS